MTNRLQQLAQNILTSQGKIEADFILVMRKLPMFLH